jgi:hypothetical protein
VIRSLESILTCIIDQVLVIELLEVVLWWLRLVIDELVLWLSLFRLLFLDVLLHFLLVLVGCLDDELSILLLLLEDLLLMLAMLLVQLLLLLQLLDLFLLLMIEPCLLILALHLLVFLILLQLGFRILEHVHDDADLLVGSADHVPVLFDLVLFKLLVRQVLMRQKLELNLVLSLNPAKHFLGMAKVVDSLTSLVRPSTLQRE